MSKFNITNMPTVTAFKLTADSAIIHVQYNTRYELCSSFMRLQEYYESADTQIQGHYFTLEEYMDSYAKANGGFSYTMDWSGFNIPHNVYHEFCDLFESHGFNKKETTLINEINRVLDDMTMTIDNLMNLKFYIIGSYKECPREANVVQHEIAHALYSLDSDYKYHADVNCNVIPFRDEMIEVLKEWGYADSIIKDELQAYVATNCKADWKSFPCVNIKDEDFIIIMNSLKTGFNGICKKYGITLPKPHTNKIRKQLEKEYKAKYGYNAGEMI